METIDAQSRHRALTEHDRTLIVEAGAGSGKTAILAGRVALMLAAGIAAKNVVAITFTEAAASELRERVVNYVSLLVRGDVPKELALALPHGLSALQAEALADARLHLDELSCSTIHGFCRHLIAPYCVEARIDPGAAVVEAAACVQLRSDVVTQWLRTKLDAADDGILSAVVSCVGVDAVAEITQWAEYLCVHGSLHGPDTVNAAESVERLITAISAFSAWYGQCSLREFQTETYLSSLQNLSRTLHLNAGRPFTSRNIVESLMYERPATCKKNDTAFLLYRCKGKWSEAAKNAGRSKADGERLNLEAAVLYAECAEAYVDWRHGLVDHACAAIIADVNPVRKAFTERKHRAALLDFDDLLTQARDLVRDYDHVRDALARRYRHILVDEFQDTDPLQAELLWRLCADCADMSKAWQDSKLRPGSLFVVADPKQAIYRFRGADIATYLLAKHSLCVSDPDACIEITANFRSDARILDFVNATFEPLLSVATQPGFTALSSPFAYDSARTALHAVDVDCEDVSRDRNGAPTVEGLRLAEARAVAECVASLLADGTVVDRKERIERACRPGDIALLAATGSSLWIYERELDALGVPLASQAGKGFFGRQEVHDLIALTRTLADPRDTLAFGAFLRGALIGLSDAEIADGVIEAHANADTLNIATNVNALFHPLLRETLGRLQQLARGSLRTTPYLLIAEAVELFHVRAVLRARAPRSPERLFQNVEKFLTLSREYDVRGLKAFARYLHEQWLAQVPMEEGRTDRVEDALVISTMHSAKGLEWPIVIPINSMTKLDGKYARFLVDRETNTLHMKVLGECGRAFEDRLERDRIAHQAEAVRLWYVALTRARDCLIIPHIVQRPSSDWMSVVGLTSDTLPRFDGVARRYRGSSQEERCPQDALTWRSQSQRMLTRSKTVTVRYPSRHDDFFEVAPDFDDGAFEDFSTREAFIAGGRERGLCLHKLLEEILHGELLAEESLVVERARVLITQLAPDPTVRLSIVELAQCVMRTLAIPTIAQLLPRLSAEVPVSTLCESAQEVEIVAGIMDAVAFTADGACELVIDWKSDVDPQNAPIGAYAAQLRAYLQASGALKGLLVFLTTGEIREVDLFNQSHSPVMREENH